MIQKFDIGTVLVPNHGTSSTNRYYIDMVPTETGAYITYRDHVRCMDKLMDKNFSLQEEILELKQLLAIRDNR
jgi:hypothetical protein